MKPRLAPLLAVLALTLAGCTGSSDEDNDGDGLPDSFERAGWDVEVTLVGGETEVRHVASSPGRLDSDGDGVRDSQEALFHYDPRDPDTDGDGLLDGPSTTLAATDATAGKWLQAEIVSREAEGDEVEFVGEEEFHTSPINQDSDLPEADGISDGDEVRGRDVVIRGESLHVETSPFNWDSDGDFLSDPFEFGYGTNPAVRDTEGDGVNDGADLAPLGNLRLDVRYKQIRMTQDLDQAEPLKAADLYVDAYLPGFSPHHSQEVDVPEGQDANVDSISPGILDVDDAGPNVRGLDFNVTVTLVGYDRDAAGPNQVDFHSRTTTKGSLALHVDVRAGTWRIDGASGSGGSGDAVAEGAHARFVVSVRPV